MQTVKKNPDVGLKVVTVDQATADRLQRNLAMNARATNGTEVRTNKPSVHWGAVISSYTKGGQKYYALVRVNLNELEKENGEPCDFKPYRKSIQDVPAVAFAEELGLGTLVSYQLNQHKEACNFRASNRTYIVNAAHALFKIATPAVRLSASDLAGYLVGLRVNSDVLQLDDATLAEYLVEQLGELFDLSTLRREYYPVGNGKFEISFSVLPTSRLILQERDSFKGSELLMTNTTAAIAAPTTTAPSVSTVTVPVKTAASTVTTPATIATATVKPVVTTEAAVDTNTRTRTRGRGRVTA